MVILPDATGLTMQKFISGNVEPGSTVVTDGLSSYYPAVRSGYAHERIVGAKGELPGVHRVAASCKRWLLGTHQGSVEPGHLQGYLNEFVFRFSRRTSRHRGLLFLRLMHLAVDHDPVRYRDLIVKPRPRVKRLGRRAATAIRPRSSARRPVGHGGPAPSCRCQSQGLRRNRTKPPSVKWRPQTWQVSGGGDTPLLMPRRCTRAAVVRLSTQMLKNVRRCPGSAAVLAGGELPGRADRSGDFGLLRIVGEVP
jgi:transposase-like protein